MNSRKLSIKKEKDFQRNVDISTKAFVEDDFEFFSYKMKRINKNNIIELDLVIYVNIKWRFQNNNDNGQVITYTKASDHNNPHCFVNARGRF